MKPYYEEEGTSMKETQMGEISPLVAYKTAAEIVELLDGWREKDSWASEWDSKEDMTQHVADIVTRRVNGVHPDDDAQFLKGLAYD